MLVQRRDLLLAVDCLEQVPARGGVTLEQVRVALTVQNYVEAEQGKTLVLVQILVLQDKRVDAP